MPSRAVRPGSWRRGRRPRTRRAPGPVPGWPPRRIGEARTSALLHRRTPLARSKTAAAAQCYGDALTAWRRSDQLERLRCEAAQILVLAYYAERHGRTRWRYAITRDRYTHDPLRDALFKYYAAKLNALASRP